ncbi:Uncharacterised protein [Cedecea neteri]|uniref:Multidrug resistance protein B n=1 Tax=Cedecea neteri TaxID=158822 RepID=A0A2X2T358_9ENTR|nr:Uncharacterised protein [Cedecea neteri]
MSTVLAAPVAKNDTTVLLVASMGCAMTVIDTNIVGVVLPTIARVLDASFADMEWVIGAYVLCFLPCCCLLVRWRTASADGASFYSASPCLRWPLSPAGRQPPF